MKPLSSSLFRVTVIASMAGASHLLAADKYWNPSPLSDNWANALWSATSGGSPLLTWAASDNAIFDQTGTYTATINADQTATNLSIKAGTVTLAGTNAVSATSITIDSGATLSGAGDRYLKVGNTSLTVNGTLDYTALALSTRRVTLAGGSGSIILGAGMRLGGDFNFAGNISGGSSGALVTDVTGIITLSGNNTYSGDTLIRTANTLRLGSATALSSNTSLRIGGGSVIELTGTDFSRTVSATLGAGNVRIGNTVDATANTFGFAAVNADRSVALNGTVQWTTASGSSAFAPTIFNLGTAASTHKVTLTTGIDLGAASRTINTANGSAAIEAEISGALSNGTLLATGAGVLKLSGNNTLVTINKGASNTDTGTLILSGSNTLSNTTLTFGTASENRGAIRLENNSALGGVTVIAGNGGTGAAQARIELANNVTISGIEYRAGGRTNTTTTGAAIVNISGNNTWAGTIKITNTGGGYGIRSDAGKLTLSGTLQNGLPSANGNRNWDIAGAGDIALSGVAQDGSTGSMSITKQGAGSLVISGNTNTYSGGTNLAAGTLLANNSSGSATGTGAVNVTGGTLGGTGSISGAVTINNTGILSPGASIESLATGALTLNTGSTLLYELNTTGLGSADLLDVNGNLDLNGTVNLSLADLGSNSLMALGTKFTMISYFGSWTTGDVFNGYADDSTFTMFGNDWRINYNDVSTGSVNGGAFTNAVTLTVVPEPGAALLGGLGLLALFRRRR